MPTSILVTSCEAREKRAAVRKTRSAPMTRPARGRSDSSEQSRFTNFLQLFRGFPSNFGRSVSQQPVVKADRPLMTHIGPLRMRADGIRNESAVNLHKSTHRAHVKWRQANLWIQTCWNVTVWSSMILATHVYKVDSQIAIHYFLFADLQKQQKTRSWTLESCMRDGLWA